MMRPRRRASDPGHELPDLNDDAASRDWVLVTTTALEKATQASVDAQRDVVFAEDRAIRCPTPSLLLGHLVLGVMLHACSKLHSIARRRCGWLDRLHHPLAPPALPEAAAAWGVLSPV